jgi:hypothetical protein
MNSKTIVLGERGKICEIKDARAMDSLQGWWWMMRLILAPKSMEGIIENYSNCEVKNQAKNTSKNHKNEKHCSSR